MTIGGSGILTSTGTIANAGTFTIQGILNAAKITNSGTLTLDGGTITATAANTSFITGSAIALGLNGGTIDNGGFDITIASGFSGANALTLTGTGTTTLTGASSSFSGDTHLNGGTLAVATSSDVLGTSGTLYIGGGTTLAASGGNQAISNAAVVGGNFTIGGANKLTLSGSINLGNQMRTITVAPTASGEFTGVVSNGGMTKDGTGTLTLSGANTYSDGTIVNAGTLKAGSATGFVNNTEYIINNGGTLDLNDFNLTMSKFSGTSGSAVDLGTAALTVDQSATTTFAGVISGTGSLTKQGTGVLTLSGSNTYVGGTTISAGTLKLGADNVLADASNVTVTSTGLFDVAGHTETIADLQDDAAVELHNGHLTVKGLDGSGTVALGSGSLTAQQGTFSGVISGTGSLIKTGGGTLTLNGSNTYTGGTTINGGYLALGADDVLADTGNVTVNSGGEFDILGYTDTIGNLADSGIVDLGSSGQLTVGSLTGNGIVKVEDGTFIVTDSGTFTGSIASGYVDSTTKIMGPAHLDLTNGLISTTNITIDTKYNNAIWTNGATLKVTDENNFDYPGTRPAHVTLKNRGTLEFSGSGAIPIKFNLIQDVTLNGDELTTTPPPPALFRKDENMRGVILVDSGSVNLASQLKGAGALVKKGAGTLTLSNQNNNYGTTGTDVLYQNNGTTQVVSDIGTLILGGTLQVGGDQYLGTASQSILLDNGATLAITNGFTTDRDIYIRLLGGNIDTASQKTLTLNGNIFNFTGPSAQGSFTKLGAGVLVLAGDNSNTYTGDTIIEQGTVQVSEDANMGNTDGSVGRIGDIVFSGNASDGGTLNITDTFSTDRSIRIHQQGTLDVVSGKTLTVSGVISDQNPSDSGKLVKSGLGTLVLTGNNTYTGGTTVIDGILRGFTGTGSPGTSFAGSLQGDITNNAIVFFDQEDDSSDPINGTYYGVMTGSGQLTKTGTGQRTLNGTNSYTGNTNIQQGTLQINSNHNLGSGNIVLGTNASDTPANAQGTLKVTDNVSFANTTGVQINDGGGAFDVVGANKSLTLTGDITGTGDLTKTGDGILDLSGANSYNGDTNINGGTIKIGSTIALGNGLNVTFDGGTLENTVTLALNKAVQINDGGATFNTDNSTILTLNGNITDATGSTTGTPALTKNGLGTLILNSANTYSGDTTVNLGTLQGFANSTASSTDGSLQGNITNKAMVVFDQASDGTYADIMSGSGQLTKTGSGVLTLTGNNTYSGGTTVSAGTLQGSTASLQGNIINNATVIFNNTSAGTYTGKLSGNGSLDINRDGISTGTITFSGDSSSFSGDTTIDNGGLILDGAKLGTGTVTAASGTTFGGTGTVFGDVVISNNATLEPGNGLLTIGNLTLNSSSTTKFDFTGGNNPQIDVTNALASAGALNINVNSGGIYTLFNYGSETGSFDSQSVTVPVNFAYNIINDGSSSIVLTVEQTGAPLLIWNGSSTGGGTGTSNTWDSATANWLDTSNVSQTWGAGDDAVFNGTAGTVTVSGTQAFHGLQFKTDGYELTGGTLAITPYGGGNGDGVINVGGSVTATINSVIADNGSNTNGFQKEGAGILVLGGINTYSGGTTLSAGTLVLANNSALGTGDLTVTDNSTIESGSASGIAVANNVNIDSGVALTVDGPNDLTLSGVIADSGAGGGGSLVKEGAGTLTLSGANTYTGGTAISDGVIALGADNALSSGGDLALAGTGELDLFSAGTAYNQTIGNLSGDGNGNTKIDLGTVGGNNLTVESGTYAGAITGAGSLTKTGTGTLTLTGTGTNRDYSGDTNIYGGTLSLNGTPPSTGSTQVNFKNNAVLQMTGTSSPTVPNTFTLNFDNGGGTIDLVSSSMTFTYQGSVTGSGDLTKKGAGALILSGDASTYTGNTTIASGAILSGTDDALGAGNDLTFTGPGGFALFSDPGNIATTSHNQTLGNLQGDGNGDTVIGLGSGTLTVGSGAYAGTIQDSGNGGKLVKNTTGALILSGNNTYTGGTTVEDGVLQAGATGAFVANTDYTVNGGTLDLGSNGALTMSSLQGTGGTVDLGTGNDLTVNQTTTTTYAGAITGDSSLTKDGTGTLTLSGANAYTGGTTINAGIIALGADNALGTGSLALAGSGELDMFSGGNAYNQTVTSLNGDGAGNTVIDLGTAGGNTLTVQSGTYAGAITGAGSLTKTGAGMLTLTNTASTYSGDTNIYGGTLSISNLNNLGSGPNLNFENNATLQITGSGFTTSSGLVINMGTGGGKVDITDSAATVIYNGSVTDNGDFSKDGAGSLVLNSIAGSYSGTTNINAGKLIVGGDATHSNAALGGTVNVNANATLGGFGTVGGDVTVNSGGTLSAGNSAGTLTIGSNLTLANDSTTVFELSDPGVVPIPTPATQGNDLVVVGGDLALDGTLQASVASAGYYRLFNYTGNLTGNFNTVDLTPTYANSQVLTNITGQVNLMALGTGQHAQFWDGPDNNGSTSGPNGGSGTWNAANTNWTTASGSINDQWRGSVAVFDTTGGTVTVSGTQHFDTLQFNVDGYTLNSGTLALDPATGTAGIINVTNAGETAVINSVIENGTTGTSLIKTGAGTLVLAGTNTYTGGTTINGGILQVSADNNLGASTGDLTFNGGTLQNTASLTTSRNVILTGNGTFDTEDISSNATNLTLNGNITGTGSLTKDGAGTLILTGNNTFSGGTTLNQGTLQGNASAIRGDVTASTANPTALIFNQDSDGSYYGTISGGSASNPLTLTKNGAGALYFSGANSFYGATHVDAGMLVVNSAGALSGHSAVTVGNTASPATSATLAVGQYQTTVKSLTLNGNGKLNVAVDAATGTHGQVTTANTTLEQNSEINITFNNLATMGNVHKWILIDSSTGTLTNNGTTVNGIPADTVGYQFGSSFANNQFAVEAIANPSIPGVTDNKYLEDAWGAIQSGANATPADPNAVALDNAVRLSSTGDQASELIRSTMMPEQIGTNMATTVHQSQSFDSTLMSYLSSRRFGQPSAMQSASLSSPLDMQMASLSSNPRFMANVVTAATKSNELPWGESFYNSTNNGSQLAPGGQPGASYTTNTNTQETSSVPTGPSHWGGFAIGYGVYTNLDTTDTSLGGKAKTYAGQFGLDYKLDKNWLVGISFTYANGKIDYDQSRGHTDMDTYRVGPYIAFTKDNWFVNASVSYALQPNDLTRVVPSGPDAGTYKASYDSNEISGYVGAGIDFPVGSWHITPNIGVNYAHATSDGYTETGTGAGAMKVADSNFDSLRTDIGVNLSTVIKIDQVNKLVPFFGAGWSRENLDTDGSVTVQSVGSLSSPFTINPTIVDRNNFYYNVGLSAILKGGLNLSLRYNGFTSSNSQTNALIISASFSF